MTFDYIKPNEVPKISLKDDFPNIGDSRTLACLSIELISEGTYGPQVKFTVAEKNPDGTKEKKTLSVSAPAPKNQDLGSQAYRAFYHAQVQPGDVFTIERTGSMNNQYRNPIYEVTKVVQEEEAPQTTAAPDAGSYEDEADPTEEVRIEDMPI